MWFNNLIIYQLNKKIDFSDLANKLSKFRARPCGKSEFQSYGFIAPLGKSKNSPLVHQIQDFYLIATQKEQRMLPSSVVKDELLSRVEQLETEQMRKIYKKEREQLRDEIIQNLLPQAFVRKTQTLAIIAPTLDLILVNSANFNRAEELLSLLRSSLGSLPVTALSTQISPTVLMTNWLAEQKIDAEFSLLDECELTGTEEKAAIIRCKRQDLSSDEITQHLAAGKVVTKLALDWQNQLNFVLDDKLIIKRLRFADELQESAGQESADDELASLDATFNIMTLTLAGFVAALIRIFNKQK